MIATTKDWSDRAFYANGKDDTCLGLQLRRLLSFFEIYRGDETYHTIRKPRTTVVVDQPPVGVSECSATYCGDHEEWHVLMMI